VKLKGKSLGKTAIAKLLYNNEIITAINKINNHGISIARSDIFMLPTKLVNLRHWSINNNSFVMLQNSWEGFSTEL